MKTDHVNVDSTSRNKLIETLKIINKIKKYFHILKYFNIYIKSALDIMKDLSKEGMCTYKVLFKSLAKLP